MASGSHLYLKTTPAFLSAFDESSDWVEVFGDAKELSRTFATAVVTLEFHTGGQVVTVTGWSKGREARVLLHTSDMGWLVKGKPLPFEDTAALRQLKKASSSPDAYELLAAVLGTNDKPPFVNLDAPAGLQGTPEELVDAAIEDNHGRVAKLLAGGVSPSARDTEGATALHRMLTGSMVKRLVEAGAKVEAKDRSGRTPLVAAFTRNNHLLLENVEALLSAGASTRAKWRGRPCIDALTSPEDANQRKRALALVKRLGGQWRPLRVDLCGETIDATPQAVRKLLKQDVDLLTPAAAARWARRIDASLRKRPEVAHLADRASATLRNR